MRRISLKTLFMLVGILALLLIPVGWLTRYSANWGPAEHTANMLGDLYHDAYGTGAAVTTHDVDELLNLPKYESLKQTRTDDIQLRDGELGWFSPNSKYSIGLHEDGRRLWIVNGERASE